MTDIKVTKQDGRYLIQIDEGETGLNIFVKEGTLPLLADAITSQLNSEIVLDDFNLDDGDEVCDGCMI